MEKFKHRKKQKPQDIRCFCQTHAAEYFNSGSYILKRLNRGGCKLDKCDKCDRLGFDYNLVDRK